MMGSEKEEKLESSSQNILLGDEKRLIDVINYEKWRDDGKYEHQKRDIKKKLRKANAIIKARKELSKNGNSPLDKE